jgi:hypothetical protein
MSTAKNEAIAKTTAWLEKFVIGLNLCPFAKAVHVKNQIRYVVSDAIKSGVLLDEVKQELSLLVETPSDQIESTLLIHPGILNDFNTYINFLDLCSMVLEEMDLDGVIQIASFHPDYQFSDTTYEDVTNYTNRSPYPMLHFLREQSVTNAVENFPNVDGIYERNIATMRSLGQEKIAILMAEVTSGLPFSKLQE